jgi:hypothetical protein
MIEKTFCTDLFVDAKVWYGIQDLPLHTFEMQNWMMAKYQKIASIFEMSGSVSVILFPSSGYFNQFKEYFAINTFCLKTVVLL